MSYTQEIESATDDLPQWMVSLARQLVRDCHKPGNYQINFTIDDHKHHIQTAVIAKVETIRKMP